MQFFIQTIFNILIHILICKYLGDYRIPNEKGYCGHVTPGDVANPENCECGATRQNYGSLCKSYCNNDKNCKGYDHWIPTDAGTPECRLFTTSSCSNGCVKTKGHTGIISNIPYSARSGCYIKLGNVIFSLFENFYITSVILLSGQFSIF